MKTERERIATTRLRYDPGQGYVKAPERLLFVQGPIPMYWISAAARLPGKCLNVALALWWLHCMKKGDWVKITRLSLEYFHVSRDAYRDALLRLSEAGLIMVEMRPGQTASVKVIVGAKPSPSTDS